MYNIQKYSLYFHQPYLQMKLKARTCFPEKQSRKSGKDQKRTKCLHCTQLAHQHHHHHLPLDAADNGIGTWQIVTFTLMKRQEEVDPHIPDPREKSVKTLLKIDT